MNLCLVGKRAKNCLIDGILAEKVRSAILVSLGTKERELQKKSSGRRRDAIHCCIRRDDPREVPLRDPHCGGHTLHDAPEGAGGRGTLHDAPKGAGGRGGTHFNVFLRRRRTS